MLSQRNDSAIISCIDAILSCLPLSFRSIFPKKKMDSAIISCIDAILADLVVLETDYESSRDYLVCWLRNLKTFVLCSRKLCNDARLGSILTRIQDTVRVFADEIHLHGGKSLLIIHDKMRYEFGSLEGELDKWSVTLLDSISLTAYRALRTITYFADNQMEYLYALNLSDPAIEAMTEQLRFLSCLLWLAKHTRVETRQDLLAHSEIGALEAASKLLAPKFYESKEEMQLKFSTLLQKIKPIDPQVCEAYTQVLCGSERLLASTEDMDDKVTYAREVVLNTLISNLWEILLRLDTCVADQLKELYGGLRSLRNILKKHPNKFDFKIGAVLCNAGVFIWPFYQTNPEVDLGLGLQDLLQTINNILADVDKQDQQIPKLDLKADVLNTFPGKSQEIEVEETTSTSNQMPSTVNEVVGFDNEARSIVERLTRGSPSLRIIAIVGMAGSGKTTLATKVFNDPSVMHHFRVRAWCPISQTLNRGKVLFDLLNQIDPKSRSEKNEEDLVDELRKSLKRRRYLIFLDDVWELDAWNRLTDGLLFPDDAVGSRIILTSRHSDAAPGRMLDQEPHFLRQLGKEESLELLRKKLLPQNGCWPIDEVHDILVQIAEVCKGLPLTIVIVAGLLATTEPGGWKEILDDLSSGLGSVTERCKNTLELSYKYLPNDLRSCLLYFGAFEEDQEVSVRKLIRLWIAEGFVQKTAAEDRLKDLIGRSLIMAATHRSDGGVKTCRIHDLLHDFCVEQAKNEHFFHFLKGCDELLAFSEPCTLRRLCIRSKAKDFRRSQLFCPGAHSLLFNCSPVVFERYGKREYLANISCVIHAFKLLKVLDLQSIYLDIGFPDEIVLLVQLAFLAIGGYIENIPSSIARLSNLETLILDTRSEPLIPGSLWNLRKLQYLYIKVDFLSGGGGILCIENIDSSPILYELDTFSGAMMPWGSMGRLLKKFPNIRRLKCWLLHSEYEKETTYEEEDTVVVVDFQSQLESLYIIYGGTIRFEFSFPETLTKLSLTSLHLSLRSISMIGKLPTLQVLKFNTVRFEEDTWEVKEGEFPNLEFLGLYFTDDFKWKACDDQFGCLKKLVLEYIYTLKETPSCFESIPTLEMIDVTYCTPDVTEMVRQIEEKQLMFGNSTLKINIVGNSNSDGDGDGIVLF